MVAAITFDSLDAEGDNVADIKVIIAPRTNRTRRRSSSVSAIFKA